MLDRGNKGSRDNGGETDKSSGPQETARITMPVECADRLGNTGKNAERHHFAERIMIRVPPPCSHYVSLHKATCLLGPKALNLSVCLCGGVRWLSS